MPFPAAKEQIQTQSVPTCRYAEFAGRKHCTMSTWDAETEKKADNQ